MFVEKFMILIDCTKSQEDVVQTNQRVVTRDAQQMTKN